MKYFLDTEFIERPGSIQLISIGVVDETGREFYCESSEFCPSDANEWVKENVFPYLEVAQGDRSTPTEIAVALLEWMDDDPHPEFWGYYADYDWVLFCWMFGRMIDLPKHFPKHCRDLKQLLDATNVGRVPFKSDAEHHALSDARWNRHVYMWIDEQVERRQEFWYSMIQERGRQIKKWGGNRKQQDLFWLAIILEELGEVAQAIISHQDTEMVAKELVEVAASCLAFWEESEIFEHQGRPK